MTKWRMALMAGQVTTGRSFWHRVLAWWPRSVRALASQRVYASAFAAKTVGYISNAAFKAYRANRTQALLRFRVLTPHRLSRR